MIGADPCQSGTFEIEFDPDISAERKAIIQFLANYIAFNLDGLLFIYSIWIFVALISIFVFVDYKKAYAMNLTTFFFPNYFFYVFLWRYSRNYFDLYFPVLMWQTFLLGVFITFISIVLSLLIKKLVKHEKVVIEDLKAIEAKNKFKCPFCGTEFNSIPKFCYNCSKEMIKEQESDFIK